MNASVSLIDMPPTPVAYYRYTGPYGPPVARFWMDRVAPWMAENELFSRVRYGIAHDDPTITEPANCRYDACVVAEPAEVLRASRCAPCFPAAATRARASKERSTTSSRLAAPARRLAARERPAARCPAAARTLPGRHEVRPADRRLRVRHLHPGEAAVAMATAPILQVRGVRRVGAAVTTAAAAAACARAPAGVECKLPLPRSMAMQARTLTRTLLVSAALAWHRRRWPRPPTRIARRDDIEAEHDEVVGGEARGNEAARFLAEQQHQGNGDAARGAGRERPDACEGRLALRPFGGKRRLTSRRSGATLRGIARQRFGLIPGAAARS